MNFKLCHVYLLSVQKLLSLRVLDQLASAELAAVAALIGKLPTPEEYQTYVAQVDKTAASSAEARKTFAPVPRRFGKLRVEVEMLAQNLTHPSKGIEKTYEVRIKGRVRDDDLQIIANCRTGDLLITSQLLYQLS